MMDISMDKNIKSITVNMFCVMIKDNISSIIVYYVLERKEKQGKRRSLERK